MWRPTEGTLLPGGVTLECFKVTGTPTTDWTASTTQGQREEEQEVNQQSELNGLVSRLRLCCSTSTPLLSASPPSLNEPPVHLFSKRVRETKGRQGQRVSETTGRKKEWKRWADCESSITSASLQVLCTNWFHCVLSLLFYVDIIYVFVR